MRDPGKERATCLLHLQNGPLASRVTRNGEKEAQAPLRGPHVPGRRPLATDQAHAQKAAARHAVIATIATS